MAQVLVHPKIVTKKSTSRLLAAFNRSMYLVALFSPVLTIPQLLLVWSNHQTSGVSLTTWGAYTVASGLWLIYGLLHRQNQLILSQALLFGLDFAVVLGVLVYR